METFSRYDTADYLHTRDDMAAYLQACLDEASDDPAFITHAFGVVARTRNVSALARDIGMSREGLHKALSGQGNPSFATILKVSRALGLKLTVEPVAAPVPVTSE